MSIFKQRIDERAEAAIGLNPSVQTGWAVRTSDVLGDEMETNPWFLSLNGMSFNESRALLSKDTVQTGISYMTKEPGISRTERIFVNPKPTSTIGFGGNAGKDSLSLLNTSVALGDMVFSGANSSIPTVIGISLYAKVTDNTQASDMDKKDASTLSGNLPNEVSNNPFAPANPFSGGLKTDMPWWEKILPPLLKQNGQVQKEDTTKKNLYGSGIRTGTLLVENSTLSNLAQGDFSQGFSF